MSTRLAILASGSGTTAEALVQATQDGRLDAEVGMIIHNNRDAKVVDQPTIKALGIATHCINNRSHPDREPPEPGAVTKSASAAMLDLIKGEGIELVLLLGFMRRVGGKLHKEYGYHDGMNPFAARMLNTHPGPLPQTKGLYGTGVHQEVYDLYKAGKIDKTGPTLHVVAADYDVGPEVQFFDDVVLGPSDTPQTIEDRVREVERNSIGRGVQGFIDNMAA